MALAVSVTAGASGVDDGVGVDVCAGVPVGDALAVTVDVGVGVMVDATVAAAVGGAVGATVTLGRAGAVAVGVKATVGTAEDISCGSGGVVQPVSSRTRIRIKVCVQRVMVVCLLVGGPRWGIISLN